MFDNTAGTDGLGRMSFAAMPLRAFCKYCFLLLILGFVFVFSGCKTPEDFRLEADRTAEKIIEEKMRQSLCRETFFDIDRPSNILRRRLLIDQNLPYVGPESLGTDQLEKIDHWPEDYYPGSDGSLDPLDVLSLPQGPFKMTLTDALQIGAQNSFEYQNRKEDIFSAALALDLERNNFRNIFASELSSKLQTNLSGERAVSTFENNGDIGVSKKLESGIELSTAIAVDLINLLTLNQASAFGITGDASVSIPLLRGSGRHIVTESLTQAERDVVYAIYEFERYKQTYAVSIAREYLSVLRQLDELKNNEENYRSLITSARRAKRRADAGRITEIEVDQAVQDELRARNRWISATESYKARMDSFKNLLDIPPDSLIELDRSELDKLSEYAEKFAMKKEDQIEPDTNSPGLSAEVVLQMPDKESAGPLEIDEIEAIDLAFENRLDLKVSRGEVYDAQRAVVVMADALGAELTLFGSANLGSSRELKNINSENADLRTDKGTYSALVTLDLPFERTSERNAYRNSYISLERAVRAVQTLEDDIKMSVRGGLRDLLEARQSVQIQAESVRLADKRVRSVNMFLEAGRAQIRDLLEAQESLLSAQNSLTAAIINYRVAELDLQAEMGVLRIDDDGLWEEYDPKVENY